jgi:hypothetical protein
MAYRYFTEKLLSSGIDLSDVFPEKQEVARDNNNVSYDLGDIAMYIKDVTENFKRDEKQYQELDSAISEIIAKWYKSKGEKNPFVEEIDVEAAMKEFSSTTPREAAIVEKGDIKSKGAPASAPSTKKAKAKEVIEIKEEPKKLEVVEKETVMTDSEKINQFKNQLEKQRVVYLEVFDDDEKAEEMKKYEAKLEADELIAEDGDKLYIERVKILTDFIKSLK